MLVFAASWMACVRGDGNTSDCADTTSDTEGVHNVDAVDNGDDDDDDDGGSDSGTPFCGEPWFWWGEDTAADGYLEVTLADVRCERDDMDLEVSAENADQVTAAFEVLAEVQLQVELVRIDDRTWRQSVDYPAGEGTCFCDDDDMYVRFTARAADRSVEVIAE